MHNNAKYWCIRHDVRPYEGHSHHHNLATAHMEVVWDFRVRDGRPGVWPSVISEPSLHKIQIYESHHDFTLEMRTSRAPDWLHDDQSSQRAVRDVSHWCLLALWCNATTLCADMTVPSPPHLPSSSSSSPPCAPRTRVEKKKQTHADDPAPAPPAPPSADPQILTGSSV